MKKFTSCPKVGHWPRDCSQGIFWTGTTQVKSYNHPTLELVIQHSCWSSSGSKSGLMIWEFIFPTAQNVRHNVLNKSHQTSTLQVKPFRRYNVLNLIICRYFSSIEHSVVFTTPSKLMWRNFIVIATIWLIRPRSIECQLHYITQAGGRSGRQLVQ